MQEAPPQLPGRVYVLEASVSLCTAAHAPKSCWVTLLSGTDMSCALLIPALWDLWTGFCRTADIYDWRRVFPDWGLSPRRGA